MLNFRKLKQDFSPTVLKEGRLLFEKKMVETAKIVCFDQNNVKLSCRVTGNFDNSYQSEIEIDRVRSTVKDSDCDCSYKYDCQHLAAAIFHLEHHFDEIIVNFSKETDIEESEKIDAKEKKQLRETFKEAETKEVVRKGKKFQKELLQEYVKAAKLLARSPFFHAEEEVPQDKAELMVFFVGVPAKNCENHTAFEVQLALRLPFRSKPLNILNLKEFLESVRYSEALYIGTKRYFFILDSFDPDSTLLLKMIMDHARFPDFRDPERNLRVAHIDAESFGSILAQVYEAASSKRLPSSPLGQEPETLLMPHLYYANPETPLRFSSTPPMVRFDIEYIHSGSPKILLTPHIILENSTSVSPEEVLLLECAKPGVLHQTTYYRFPSHIKRQHLRYLPIIRDMVIPEPLFGTFVENTLPELLRTAEVSHRDLIEQFVTYPFTGNLGAICEIQYLNGELEASLNFIYDNLKVPAAPSKITNEDIHAFISDQGILARNLSEEQSITEDLFQGFLYDEQQGVYIAKTDKKIIEFMTEVIPHNQHRVHFNCPKNLLEQFIYDNTHFKLHLSETSQIHLYEVNLKVEGHLNGITVDLLWECISSKRAFIELSKAKGDKRKQVQEDGGAARCNKILVLDLEKLAPVVQIFDELGIHKLNDHTEQRPLWSLASVCPSQFENLPIQFSMTPKLHEVQQQMLGKQSWKSLPLPKAIQAVPRSYQIEGIDWLNRLRAMHLNGILADDMGLGKTLQAIIALTHNKQENPQAISIVVCPTSLVHNWKEEIHRFNPELKCLPVDGSPPQRQKLFADIKNYDIVITSYNLLQKDIDFYKTVPFSYAILDEAQHIKNRSTRNAKSVKMICAAHRLILTGTPIENSLDELWSLFDYLMPGLLSSFERFVERFIRPSPQVDNKTRMDALRRKVTPFILRRMKKDVLSDLPPVSEIIYHCHLSDTQRELYRSYASSAREELIQLVKKEGFDNVQIHVLATITRLKQICCHPAIFAKEKPESGDSAKYDMLLELLQSLLEGKHKTVIFSQYTRMLNIMRQDLEKMGLRICYLDGSSKNRMGIVKQFNEDENISVFLISLKAGGSGINLTGADTVIHYDMWWNPAVENQATDRVHRIGQKSSVSSYKLITLGTIEEKILALQSRKKGLVTQIISSDDEAISKLTWEEVLELLET